ncbi:Type I phosphodiesterase / nucleotide pyrophosphatase [Nakamurella panacisegetis]|uniref:Type I phosphodiesterase / nucleotide pyrophosphatase n=1 Tax=Nakamurella panacisegetis TaxID=1090615 RepID=A0A1H0QN78_9ACTN|nr:alkaline phosphatase family protein [Nakamurella panacisegetis]SDP18650.1 Type I phosphodiesterase / nucleotide pyrophosphatase [Nakamurella panacisegetis]
MFVHKRYRIGAAVLAATLLAASVSSGEAGATSAAGTKGSPVKQQNHVLAKHVLVLSVDGLHQTDLAWYIRTHPHSALASLVASGTEYTNAQTTFPSDSFPGMVAALTGGGPGTSGVFYDDTYNRALLPAGTLDCSTATPGTEVSWTEAADRSQSPITLDAGQKLSAPVLTALPTNTLAETIASSAGVTAAILKMTPTPQALIDPATLPVNPTTCLPVYPSQYLRVNTVFEVARAAGLRTAWSDKHPAYEILNGPSGAGVQDLFTPEINGVADNAGDDWTTDNALTQEYDSTKVAAIVNEINGFDHSGSRRVGTPAIFGMNFQTVSTAQKLPVSDGLAGGYHADGTPGPLVQRALTYIDTQVDTMTAAIRRNGLTGSTAIILSAKHGQAPVDESTLRRVDDGKIIAALDSAWAADHPAAAPLVSFSVDDDGMLLWLSDRSSAALDFAQHFLLTYAAPANLATDSKGVYSATVDRSGLTRVYTGRAADTLVRARNGDSHAPDLIGITQPGVVYTGGVKKIAEHGGDAPADLDVALVVSGPVTQRAVNSGRVRTTQIAPTILRLLGLNPNALQAVRIEHTAVLPGL